MHRDDDRMTNPAFDHFGLLAPLYDKLIKPPKVDTLLELLAPEPSDAILDVGGGTGRCVRQLTGRFSQTVVLDVSHPMLSQASSYQYIYPVQGQAEALPFEDNVFNRIIAVDSFHHFHNRSFASQELLRVLAPGGRLVIEEPDIRSWIVKFIALGETLLFMRSHFQPPERIRQYFLRPGNRVKIVENEIPIFWVVVDKLAAEM